MVFLIVRRGEVLRLHLASRAEQDQRKQDFLVECLGGIQAVKAMAMEPQIQRRYERLQKRSAEINYAVINLSQSLQSLGTLTSAVSTVVVVTTGALMVIGGSNLSIGALACCSLLSGRLMQPIMKGVGVWSEHQNRMVSHERAKPLMKLQPRQRPAAVAPARCAGAIRLTGITCWTENGDHPALGRVDLAVRAGETIAFRPDDGAAKALLFGIISGQIAPTTGRVEIDGKPIETGWGPDLDAQIATVSNNSEIFAGSILENLTMFGGSAPVDRARTFARAIGLEASIDLLPDGYDTQIGDAVVHELPNGLIQQIAIVRALARDPAILIVDEAYTSLDTAADRLVQTVIAGMRGERTIVIAAHRPSYLALADRQFEIADGQVYPLAAASPAAARTGPDAEKVPA
jgi:ATP-binding cassette subfamily C protein LapB